MKIKKCSNCNYGVNTLDENNKTTLICNINFIQKKGLSQPTSPKSYCQKWSEKLQSIFVDTEGELYIDVLKRLEKE